MIDRMARPAIEIEKLDVDERLELIETLWESLRHDPDSIPVTDAQKKILDERLDRIDAGDNSGSPWSEVRDRILKRLT
jgi:putative addiction module component (TIGR02574 family)